MPFLHMTGLGKQVKKAYSAGHLKVEAFEDHTVIVTPHCAIAVAEEHEPNKMKAIITEYLGYVPVHDPASRNAGFVETGKSGQQGEAVRDLEPEETERIKKLLFNNHLVDSYIITPVILIERGQQVRIIQDVETLRCLGIRQELLELITNKDLNYDIEGDPVGPAVDLEQGIAYFTNTTTTLSIIIHRFSTDKAKETLDILQLMALQED
jgi:hypothetical protein